MLTTPTDFSGYAFVAEPIDRADTLRDDPEALARLWPQARILVLDADGTAFTDAQGQWLALTGAELGGGPGTAVFLGMSGGVANFSIEAGSVPVQAPGRIDLRQAASSWPAAESSLFCFARGMSYWHSRNRFCGVCGGPITFRRAGFVGGCPQCATEHYPRVDPAVIVAVENNGRLLLGRQPKWAQRRFSVVAGFVEPGESLEQTVAREVFEETRVRVRRSHYLGTQPWPFPGALMLGFWATAENDVPTVDGELEEARWFSRDEVAAALNREADDGGDGILLPPKISIARTLIEHWYHRQHG